MCCAVGDMSSTAHAQLQATKVASQQSVAKRQPFSEVTLQRLPSTESGEVFDGPQLRIRFDQQGVSLQAQSVPLLRVLQDLSWQGGFELEVHAVSAYPISALMREVPLTTVLSTLLRDYSYVLTREAGGAVSKLLVMDRDDASPIAWRSEAVSRAPGASQSRRPLRGRGRPQTESVVVVSPTVPMLTLTDYLSERDANRRRELLRSQVGDTSEEAVLLLQSVLDVESHQSLQTQALALLGQHPSPSVVPVLVALASDANAPIRLEAAQQLLGRDQAEAVTALAKLAYDDADAEVRAQAGSLLRQVPTSVAHRVWSTALEQQDQGPVSRFPISLPVSIER